MTIAMTEKAKTKMTLAMTFFKRGGGRYGLDTIMIYNVTKLMITMA